MRRPPKVVFLDQNKWIDLAHAMIDGAVDSDLLRLGKKLADSVVSGDAIIPLTSNLIVETYKMKNDQSRSQLAEIQSKFSQGLVFRNRDETIRSEIYQFICRERELPLPVRPLFWWLSRNFIEAFASWQQLSAAGSVEPDQLEGIVADPKFALFHWLATAPDSERDQAMEAFESGSDFIINHIQERSALAEGADFAMRRRAYSANLLRAESSRIIAMADLTNTAWLKPGHLDGPRIKRLMREVPAYHAETELAVRIEAMNRPVERNDLGDMGGYVSSIPYADVVVGENLFVNMAKQAGLGKKYGCVLSTDIFVLDQIL